MALSISHRRRTDVVNYVLQNPTLYDIHKITLGGFSAGATMALGISNQLGIETAEGKFPSHPIQAGMPFYLVTEWDDRTLPTVTEGKEFPGVILPIPMTELFDAAYFFPGTFELPVKPLKEDQRVQELQANPLITPLVGKPEHFPQRVALITCEYDTLTVGSELLRRKIQEGNVGNRVYGWTVPGVGHAWDVEVAPGLSGFEERNRAYDLVVKTIAQVGGLDVDI